MVEKVKPRKREKFNLLIIVQNNSVRTNHFKAKIDNSQMNSECRLYGDRNETIHYIISKCSNLAYGPISACRAASHL